MPQNSIDINYSKFFLSNGIKVVLYPRSEIHSVSIQVKINVGGLDEDKSSNGFSHLIEHVVHDGTKGLPTWEDLDNFTNEYSGNTNAYTSLDHTKYYGTFPSQYLEQAIFYLSEVSFHPLLKNDFVDKERAIVIDEMKRSKDEIDYKVLQNIKDNRFVNNSSSYSFDIIGTQESLEKSNSEILKEYHSRFYVPDNTEIYIVGNIDIAQTKEWLNKYFVKDLGNKVFKNKPVRSFKLHYPDYAGFKINTTQKLDIDQVYLTIDFPGFEFATTAIEERHKQIFVGSITATSEFNQSLLWKRLREELGIVYDVSTWRYDMFARRIHAIETAFRADYLETVLTEIHSGIEKIIKGDIKDNVFLAKKKKLVDTQPMLLDKPENVLGWIENYENELEQHKRGLNLSEYLKFAENLKFEDVIETAKQIYNWKNVQIGVVSQKDSKEQKIEVEKIWNKLNNQK